MGRRRMGRGGRGREARREGGKGKGEGMGREGALEPPQKSLATGLMRFAAQPNGLAMRMSTDWHSMSTRAGKKTRFKQK